MEEGIGGGKRKYEEVVEEGRGRKVLKSESPRAPGSKGPWVQRSHGPWVQRSHGPRV